MTDLATLAATLTAVDPDAPSWAWTSADEAAYIDCSTRSTGPGVWLLEVGDGQETAQIELSLQDLREIHRQLTTALIAATAA